MTCLKGAEGRPRMDRARLLAELAYPPGH
jgi:hypothetical protein